MGVLSAVATGVGPAAATHREAVYLGAVAAGVLALCSWLAGRLRAEQARGQAAPRAVLLGALVVALVAWSVPVATTRAAASMLVLALVLVSTVAQLSTVERSPVAGEAPAASLLRAWSAGTAWLVAAQLLLRSDRWVTGPFAASWWLDLVGLPLLAGLAWALLAGRHGRLEATLALGGALLLSGGLASGATAAVVAFAATAEAADRSRWWPLRGLAGAVVLLALGAETRLAVLAVLAALGLAGGWLAALAALLSLVMGLALPLRGAGEAWSLSTLLLWLFPALAWPFGRERRGSWLAALLVAGAGALAAPASAALVPAALLAGLSLPAGSWARLQRAWVLVLAVPVLVLASYPWLRPEALRSLLVLAGPGAAPWPLLITLLLATAAASLLARLPLMARGGRVEAGLAAALALALVLGQPPAGRVLFTGPPVVVDAARPMSGIEIEPQNVTEVVVDSQLSHAADLPAGADVAVLRLLLDSGASVLFPLRAGIETGEWAARRPDVAGRPGFVAPASFRAQLVADGVLAQTYRTRLRLPAGTRARRVEVERAAALPAEVALLINRVELRR